MFAAEKNGTRLLLNSYLRNSNLVTQFELNAALHLPLAVRPVPDFSKIVNSVHNQDNNKTFVNTVRSANSYIMKSVKL